MFTLARSKLTKELLNLLTMQPALLCSLGNSN